MTTGLLPGKRYLVRELLPRAILLALTFWLLLPRLPFHLLEFRGGALGAAALGIAFTAMFSLFGAYLMGSAVMVKFMDEKRSAWWFIPFNVALVLGVPALAMALAADAAPAILTVNGWVGALAGSVVLNIACALTHDYGAGG